MTTTEQPPTHIVYALDNRLGVSHIAENGHHLLSSSFGTFSRLSKSHVVSKDCKLLYEGTERGCREFIAATNLVKYD